MVCSLPMGAVVAFILLIIAPPCLTAENALVHVHITVEHVRVMKTAASNQDVVVWLEPLDHDPPSPSTSRKYRMAQRDKQFHPHVLAVPVGTAVEFPNEDPFFHNVFSLYMGKRFDLGLYEAGSSRTVHFDRPGVSFIFCNIHPEMNAYILVLETPYFAITDPKGEIRIPNVRPGRYRLRVWYERAESAELAGLSRDVTISGFTADLGKIGVWESARLIPQHLNKHGRPYDTDRLPYPSQ